MPLRAFDPADGTVLVEPPGDRAGCWVGAPGIFRHGDALYVSYRLRRPAPDRGYESRVALVAGERATTLWTVGKEQLEAESIERSALIHHDGRWRLYVSHVDARDRRWRISLLESATIQTLDATLRRTVLHPDDLGLAAVKDPWIRIVDGRWHMFVSCGATHPARELHATGDALSTGLVRSETGLATSDDGIAWRWEGVVFSPSVDGWDRSTARLSSAVRTEDGWLGFYDGAATLAQNYEERCGIASSADLRSWERISTGGPALGSPDGAHGVRYLDLTERREVVYEYTRADGSHDLRFAPPDVPIL
ncbi:MAG TPA: hypothetical protein VM052_05440 [Candidatus Limnocylindrales bacterium]|nr:hypothetical protein [Candidatus Limnocylindrales bacterium]